MQNINPHVQAAIVKHLTPADQIRFAVSKDWTVKQATEAFGHASPIVKLKYLLNDGKLVADGVSEREYVDTDAIRKAVTKAAVAAASTTTASALYYPTQAAGVLLPPVSPSIISALVSLGAPELPPNVRLLTQAANLSAVEVAEGAPTPAAAPSLGFMLTATDRKFALIVAYGAEMLAASNFDSRVQAYVEQQLTIAANNATDTFMLGLFDAGTAQTTVAAAIAAFAGDLRTACWVGNPETLAGLRSAQETNVGPLGGTYYQLPAISTVAAGAHKLYLVDRKRVALFDGPMEIMSTGEASILMDSAPGSAVEAVSNLFQENKVALKVTKYADAKLLTPAQVITLA